jgi:hypothetical protein
MIPLTAFKSGFVLVRIRLIIGSSSSLTELRASTLSAILDPITDLLGSNF